MPCIYEHDFFVSYPHPGTPEDYPITPEANLLTEFVDELAKTIRFLRTGDRLPEPVYVDRKRLQPGFSWDPELAKAICRSRALLVVYTDDYFAREYCLREWEAMRELEARRVGKTSRSMVIPLLLRASTNERNEPILPQEMRELQYEDFRSILAPRKQFTQIKVRQKVERLLHRINDLKRQSPDPRVDCDSYDLPPARPPVMVPPMPAPEAYGGMWLS